MDYHYYIIQFVKAFCNFNANASIENDEWGDALKYAIIYGKYGDTELILSTTIRISSEKRMI